MPYRRLSVLALLLLASPRLCAVDLLPLKGAAATLHWDAPQFVQADAQGNVYLLRGDTLEVYPVTKAHDLGEPVRLELGVRSGSPIDAAMSSRGDWVLNLGTEVHYLTDGKDKALPALRQKPVSVGFLRDEPVAMVEPSRGEPVDDDRRGPPLLLRPAHDGWTPELREPLQGGPGDAGAERAFRAALVLDAGAGRYFLARQYAYRIALRRLGRERPLEELRLGSGEPVIRKSTAGDEERLRTMSQDTDTRHGTISVFHGVSAILALARGNGDGRLYVLVGAGVAGERCALDRIDWDERRVERVSLNLPCLGRASLAAGRDGLYLAEFSGERGRFFLPWAALDAAPWSLVKEAAFTP